MHPNSELISHYFPNLSDTQKEQFQKLGALYADWNQKINVVSRKDVELIYERHILHSLSIAKIIEFKAQSKIMDVGTGGGFPGIPLAILFPDCEFYLVDSIAKKVKVVLDVVEGLGLENVRSEQIRMEDTVGKFDFVLNRAVAPLKTLLYWTKNRYKKESIHDRKNGLISLKGGDLGEEIQEARVKDVEIFEIKDLFEEEFFETKKIIYIPIS